MQSSLHQLMSSLLGLDTSPLSVEQICVRAVAVYIVTLMMVRVVGNRRFAGKYAAIDIILSITLGATLSRAINGSAPFFPTLGAGLTLVGMHWLMAALAFHLPFLEPWIKGESRLLIKDGQLNYRALKTSHLTARDLRSVVRSSSSLTELDQVGRASLEPSGDISVLSQSAPKTIDISVEDNVKTVRILIS
ncbi:MAG: YetF domain-containing protein [Nodosilinea sp.]